MMKLYTMEGMAGINDSIDVTRLSDVEAGVHFFKTLDRMAPGITWRELQDPQLMGGWWTNLKKATSATLRKTGNLTKDIVNVTGRKIGEATRLITDEKVMNGVSRAAMAYASGGGSEAVNSASGGGGGFSGLLSKAGKLWKSVTKKVTGGAVITPQAPKTAQYATIQAPGMMKDPKNLMIAGGIGLAVVTMLIMFGKKK